MESSLTLNTRWNSEGLELSSEQIATLETKGYERAYTMYQEGYVQGELCELVTIEDEEHTVSGWWSVSHA